MNNNRITKYPVSLIVVFLFSLAIFLAACSDALIDAFDDPSSPSRLDEEVTIIRDAWGIPQIFADTDEGVMYGLGYCCAEDRLFQMEYSRRIIQGRLSEMLGFVGNRNNTSLDSDIKNRHLQYYDFCLLLSRNLDEETKALLQAFCDGVNEFTKSSSSQLTYLFAEFGITPEPWTIADCLASWMRIASFFSPNWTNKARMLHGYEDLLASGWTEEDAVRALSTQRILDEDAAVVREADFDPALKAELEDYSTNLGYSNQIARNQITPMESSPYLPKFSHAWVIGGNRTTSGAAVLNSDPQTTVRNPSVWYEFHVHGKTFDARGIGVAGCPGLLIGWNSHVAWGLTALGGDMADIFRLEMKSGDPASYLYDGEEKLLVVRRETIKVRGGRDTQVTVKSCHLGPIVTPLVNDRREGEEYALKTSTLAVKDRHTIQALFRMMRAKDVQEFGEAITDWISPGVNVLFGDSAGNIGYWMKAGIPLRSLRSPLGSSAAQSGAGKDFDWIDIIPHRFLPHVINPPSGVLFSGNHIPVGSWYPLPLGIGTGGSGDTQRSWRLRTILTGGRIFEPEDMIKVHFDDVNQAIFTILKAGYHSQSLGQPLSRGTTNLLLALKPWYDNGAHCDSNEPNFAGAFHIRRNFRISQAGPLHDIYGGGDGGLCFFLKTLDSKINGNPNYQLDDAELGYIDASLEAGWNTAVKQYGSDPADWKAGFRQSTARLQVPYFTNLEGFPSLDSLHDFKSEPLQDPEGSTIWSQKANSYSQWVDLSDVDRSLAVLPVGISENPGSPFYRIEQNLWETGTLRPAPLSRSAVMSNRAPIILTRGKK